MSGSISNTRLSILLVTALALALIAAGCGGSDDDGSSSSSVQTKEELIAKGDAICDKEAQRVKDEAKGYMTTKKNGAPFIASEAQYVKIEEEVFLPAMQREVDQLRALGAPSGEEEKVEEWLDEFQTGIEKAEKDPTSLFNPPNPMIKANKLAGEYGFESCGYN